MDDSEEMTSELVLEGKADYYLAKKKKSISHGGKAEAVTSVALSPVTAAPGLGSPGASHLLGAEMFTSTCRYERT